MKEINRLVIFLLFINYSFANGNDGKCMISTNELSIKNNSGVDHRIQVNSISGFVYKGIECSQVIELSFTSEILESYTKLESYSKGIIGLKVTSDSIMLNKDNGILKLSLTGKAQSVGVAYFELYFGESKCEFQIEVFDSKLSAGCDLSLKDYETVSNVPGEPNLTWITRNLGAYIEAENANDTTDRAAGCYFYFSNSNAYGSDINDSTFREWPCFACEKKVSNGDWDIESDPCRMILGGNWRLPTKTEWSNVDKEGHWYGKAKVFTSKLKLHSAGFLNQTSGYLYNRGLSGHYWSSSSFDTINAWYFYTIDTYSNTDYNNKNYGFTVRCVK